MPQLQMVARVVAGSVGGSLTAARQQRQRGGAGLAAAAGWRWQHSKSGIGMENNEGPPRLAYNGAPRGSSSRRRRDKYKVIREGEVGRQQLLQRSR